MANWYNEHVASQRNPGEADFGIGTVVPSAGSTYQGNPTKTLAIAGAVVTIGLGAVVYKLVTDMDREQRRLTPRRRY